MPNHLTGDYDAVVQVAIRQINGLLGTLHQNGASDTAPLRLLHSAIMRVGDSRRPDLDVFGDWVLEFQQQSPRPATGAAGFRAQLTAVAPPGAAKLLGDLFTRFDELVTVDPAGTVRGKVKLQLSSVTISVPNGSTSEVTVHAGVRARYYPDTGTTDMPAPVHGEVQAAFDVRKVTSGTGRKLLIRPSSQDSTIQFIPASGTGLSAVDANRISAEVRKVLREGLMLLPVDLPQDFPFADFKGLGTGAGQVIALPFSLSGAALPPGGIQSVTQSFIGSSGFGFAVRKEYVQNLIDLDAIRQAITQHSITLTLGHWGVSFSVTYQLSFSSGPAVTFKSGAIEISGRVDAKTGTWWAPNGYVSFKQTVTLVLDPSTQRVTLRAVGGPIVDQSWFIPHGRAVAAVQSQVDHAIADAAVPVARVFDDAKRDLNKGLKTFDPSASATYTSVEITPDGIIVRGEVAGAWRAGPIVKIAETDDGASFEALQSWIPGGRIDRFVWSWVEYPDPNLSASVLSGVFKSLTDEHRFTFSKPASITSASQICLRIEGTQTLANGSVVNVAGGDSCLVPEPGLIMDVPSWLEPVTVPVWLPDVREGGMLREAIAGHVTVQMDRPEKDALTHNSLVYFADSRADMPLDVIGRALKQMRSKNISLMVIVVLPVGAFDTRRADLERKLALMSERFSVPVRPTEDDDGGWTRTFAVSKTPSIYLINGRRECVWRHEGEPDPQVLAAALDKYLVPAPGPRFRPLRLTVSPGDRAPDALVHDSEGQETALHRLRGRQVLVNFWQSWSAPCLAELRRLQALSEQRGKEAPYVVAFHGGKDGRALDSIRKQLGLSFPLVQDSGQQTARNYGVRCWPTTVSVDAEGRVDHIQFGISHHHDRAPVPGRAQAS